MKSMLPETTPCAVCQRVPTMTKNIGRNVGMIVAHKYIHIKQPLCRDHGIEVSRDYLNKTLVQGWWGVISFFMNFALVAGNATILAGYKKMPPPGDAPVMSPSFQPAMTRAPVITAAPAGWHADPHRRHDLRYWDGQRWTEHVSTQGQPGHDWV